MEIKELLLDYLFPGRCAVCDEVVERKTKGVCNRCREKIRYIESPFCLKCGKQLKESQEEFCEDCQKKHHLFKQGTALYDYGSMADSLFRFKYAGRQEYALFYGRQLYEKKKDWILSIKPDALVPVPIHASRKRQRGYNQAELIAEALSELTGIPVEKRLVARCKKTLPQKELSVKERQNNLKRAFKILRNDVKLNTIVIIDDIYTTGSTINAMSEALTRAGIPNIYYMVLAVGRGV